jgi:protein-S-isoprenylcysteine O-methyltransferase Ste14
MEVFYLPTVTGGAIQEFAGEVTSKALLDRFDEELELGLISGQCCIFERHPCFFFLLLFLFPLRFFLSSLFFLSLLF